MAAFTTLAIAALAGGAGGLLAGKKLGQRQSAPGATDATAPTLAPPPAPTSTAQATSNATVVANAAAAKQRKKASASNVAGVAKSTIAAPQPKLAATTLLGY